MKKKVLTVFLAAVLLSGCGNTEQEAHSASYPSQSPNGNNAGAINLETAEADMSGYKFLSDEDPAFLEITMEESMRLIEEDGTGVVLYSYEDCPWCNRAVPILNQAAKEEGVTIFYVNIYSDYFMAKSSDEQDEIVAQFYSEYEPALEHQTDEDTGETSIVLQVPLVVGVKDGEIVDHHLGIVDSFELDSDNLDEFQVTTDQKNELLMIYEGIIEETLF